MSNYFLYPPIMPITLPLPPAQTHTSSKSITSELANRKFVREGEERSWYATIKMINASTLIVRYEQTKGNSLTLIYSHCMLASLHVCVVEKENEVCNFPR